MAVGETTTRSSSTVMNLQKLLADRGFYNGAVDGLMGSQTRAAIIAAQKAYNLTADGVAGSQTLAALESDGAKAATKTVSSTTSTPITKSAEVSNLQELLGKRGFYNGAVDGLMGPQTRTAIVAAQKNYGLVTDGIAGSQTLTALESGAIPVTIAAKNPETTATVTAKTHSPVRGPSVRRRNEPHRTSILEAQKCVAGSADRHGHPEALALAHDRSHEGFAFEAASGFQVEEGGGSAGRR